VETQVGISRICSICQNPILPNRDIVPLAGSQLLHASCQQTALSERKAHDAPKQVKLGDVVQLRESPSIRESASSTRGVIVGVKSAGDLVSVKWIVRLTLEGDTTTHHPDELRTLFEWQKWVDSGAHAAG
jgi:hypothetical protein